jgi:hypothetical protein
MATRKNEFLLNRIAVANFPVLASAAAQTIPSGVFIPGGALVTGVTFRQTAAPTIANAANTINLLVVNTALSSSISLISAVALSAHATHLTRPYAATLSAAVGSYIPVSGELKLNVEGSNGTAVWTYAPDIYVGYVCAK